MYLSKITTTPLTHLPVRQSCCDTPADTAAVRRLLKFPPSPLGSHPCPSRTSDAVDTASPERHAYHTSEKKCESPCQVYLWLRCLIRNYVDATHNVFEHVLGAGQMLKDVLE